MEFSYGHLRVRVFDTTQEMADEAATAVATCIRKLLTDKAIVNVAFSGAESQEAFHKALAAETSVDWSRVNAIAVDEFWSPDLPVEFSVRQQPQRDLYSEVNPRSILGIDCNAPDPERERERYDSVIAEHPPDVVCLGVGVSGHIALNEPGERAFQELHGVELVDIHPDSIRQLEEDPNFSRAPKIPRRGITISLKELMRSPNAFVVVPFSLKAPVVARMLASDVTEDLPATILANHPNAEMYLDADSYSMAGRHGQGDR